MWLTRAPCSRIVAERAMAPEAARCNQARSQAGRARAVEDAPEQIETVWAIWAAWMMLCALCVDVG